MTDTQDKRVQVDISKCPLHEVDTFGPEFLQDPHPFYARLRAEAPVYRDPKNNVVYVSTYDLIRQVNTQPKLFSNRFAEQLRSGSTEQQDPDEVEIIKQGWIVADTMLTADPPQHTRYRKLAMKAFTYRRVLQMTAYVEELVESLIDELPESGRIEFKSEFANKLPMYVIADALGVPREHFDQFEEWSNAFLVQLGGVAAKEERLWAAGKIVEFQKYFVEVIERKRANPTEDVISDLVHADLSEEGDDRKMTYEELLSILQQLLVAGNETTAHTLTAGLYFLLTHPEQLDALSADPTLVKNFVEETLRFLSPTNNMWRVATADTEIGGEPIRKNDLILVRYGSGNRDEAKFADADRFDMLRTNAKEHLAFGGGIHTCLGSQLARKELQTAFPILLRRLKNIRLDPPDQALRFLPSILLRGVFALDVAFEKAPAPAERE
ncbi:MAG: cytochrome P450 [Pseudomonadota bacterium]